MYGVNTLYGDYDGILGTDLNNIDSNLNWTRGASLSDYVVLVRTGVLLLGLRLAVWTTLLRIRSGLLALQCSA